MGAPEWHSAPFHASLCVFMDLAQALNHLLNFVAPAFVLALGLVLCARFLGMKTPLVQAWWAQAAITFAVGCLALLAGLWFFGNDGKMASYAALVLASALCQWVLVRGWR